MKKQNLHLSALKADLNLSKAPIIIAVSGGSDSIALLHILSALYPDNQRIAVYIDHGLRPAETEAEKQLVADIAASCSATFISRSVDTTTKQQTEKLSLEEAARMLRYQALETIRKQHGGQCIAVGHTRDDQAEEILLRLIRGSGSAGLSGMAKQNGYIIRPLLSFSKASLRDYLKEHGAISYCEDSSNSDLRFLRNRIRHDLLPLLEEGYNRSIRTTLLQTATVLRDEDQLLDTMCDQAFKAVSKSEEQHLTLDIPAMLCEPVAIQRRVFEKLCWHLSTRPSYKQIAALLELLYADNNSEIHLGSGLRAIKEHQQILFHFPRDDQGYRGPAVPGKEFAPLSIPAPGNYSVPELGYQLIINERPYTKKLLQQAGVLILDAKNISFPLTLRHHQPGERFHPLGSSGSRKVSRFLTDQKIPPTKKHDYPVLVLRKNIIAVLGLRTDEAYRTSAKTLTCLELQWRRSL